MSYIEIVKRWLYEYLSKMDRPLKMKEICLKARADREGDQELYDLTAERIAVAVDELIREYKVRSAVIDDEWVLKKI